MALKILQKVRQSEDLIIAPKQIAAVNEGCKGLLVEASNKMVG